MRKIGKNSIEFENVFLRATSTVAGPKESKGPLGKYFDVHLTIVIVGKKTGNKLK